MTSNNSSRLPAASTLPNGVNGNSEDRRRSRQDDGFDDDGSEDRPNSFKSRGRGRDRGRGRHRSGGRSQPHGRAPIQLSSGNATGSREEHRAPSGGGGKWQSEDQLVNSLSSRFNKLSSRGTGDGLDTITIAKNVLVEKFENESTTKCSAEWRRRPVIPTQEELMRDDVEVPCNVIEGPYESVDEYLETHYELLREDVVAGLREAVQYVRQWPDSDDTREIAIYERVRVIGLTYADAGVSCKVTFSLNRAGKRIRWANSKRLIPGTLVCLSDDNFQTFKVATVLARPLSGLEMNPPELDLLFQPDDIEIDSNKTLLMVESRQGYFESSKWVLYALQRMNSTNMPLAEHICFLDKGVGPPKYVEDNPRISLTSIFPDNADTEILEEVDILHEWPDGAQTSMDKSQIDALKSILTKRVAVIQGPPGTGKTYTSVMALHALLQNMADDDPPIIVACQTNHALDQLLNHVQKFENDIVRLGGRTQDKDKILEKTLYRLRKKHQIAVRGSRFGLARVNLERIRQKITAALTPLTTAPFLSPEALFKLKLITKKQMESFEKTSSQWVSVVDDEKPDVPIAQWLGDNIRAVDTIEDVYYESQEDDADVAYEQLKELEAEFMAGDPEDTDDGLRGVFLNLKRKFTVIDPLGVTTEDLQQAIETQDIWDLPDHLRAAFYCYLEEEAKKRIFAEVRQLTKQYAATAREFKIAKMEKDAYILSKAKLVGMTTTGLSKYRSLVASVQPKIVLIEEAAEVLEGPVTVGCLPSIQHLILVGDHKQLQGKTAVHSLADEPYYLNVSMFERLVLNDLPYVSLRTQRRMRPEIREILKPIYQDQLEDHVSVLGRDPVPGMGNVNLYFFCHNTQEEMMEDTPSKCNKYEAQMIVKFLEYFILNQIPADTITVLTFYSGQRSLIAKLLGQNVQTRNQLFKLATVDSYQGEENDIIILSLVRSNYSNQIGFLNVSNRVCVALSRAQRGLYIFGDGQMITNVSELWWDVGMILNRNPPRMGTELPLKCHKHKATTKIEGLNDWDDINGGCKRRCNEILPCKHICPLKCHPFDHELYRCLETCNRPPMPCGHICAELCYRDCRCEICGRTLEEMKQDPELLAAAAADTEARDPGPGKTVNGGIILGPRPGAGKRLPRRIDSTWPGYGSTTEGGAESAKPVSRATAAAFSQMYRRIPGIGRTLE